MRSSVRTTQGPRPTPDCSASPMPTSIRPRPTTTPPAAERCAALLDEAIRVVNANEDAAVVRAGWFTATVLAIHPFTDGNGRTARLLHHLVAGSDQAAGAEVGTAEVWAVARDAYVAALKASQRPAIAVTRSTRLRSCRSRSRPRPSAPSWCRVDSPRCRISGMRRGTRCPESARVIEMAVALDSTSTLAELGDLAQTTTPMRRPGWSRHSSKRVDSCGTCSGLDPRGTRPSDARVLMVSRPWGGRPSRGRPMPTAGRTGGRSRR